MGKLRYPIAEGSNLDALAANMGLTRRKVACRKSVAAVCDHDECAESDEQMRARIVAYIREPQAYEPIGRRQAAAVWLSQHRMPTFASWLYPGYYFRVTAPRFVGEIPPRWVMERDIDGGFSWP